MLQPRVAILMPTWNGEKFLCEQVDSLLAQDYPDFLIVTRDDGSRDSSPAIIAEYASRFPQCFHVVPADGRNLGASGSFAFLMDYALREKVALRLTTAYLMLSDQDDVWHADKLAKSMQLLQDLEAQRPGLPVLVHGDLQVVDEARRQIAPSFVRYQGLEPRRNSFGRLLVSNTVTGCTALCNEALVRRALPIPVAAVMHDWWLALVAGAFGTLGFLDEPLLEYRQHGANTIGAKEYRRERRPASLLRRLRDPQHDDILTALSLQAAAFQGCHREQLTMSQRGLLLAASILSSRSTILRKVALKFFHRL